MTYSDLMVRPIFVYDAMEISFVDEIKTSTKYDSHDFLSSQIKL